MRSELSPGGYAFVRKKIYAKEVPKHKIAPIADGPYQVVSFGPDTSFLDIKGEYKRLSLDRIMSAPRLQTAVGGQSERESGNEIPSGNMEVL